MKIKKLFCLLVTVIISTSAFAGNALAYYDGSNAAYYHSEPKVKIGSFTYLLKDYAQYGSVKIQYSATVLDIPNVQKVEIPEKITYNGTEFTVTDIDLSYGSYEVMYNNIEEFILPETIYNISNLFGFTNLKKINLPKNTMLGRSNTDYLIYSDDLEKGFYDLEHNRYLHYCPNLKLSVDPNNPYYYYKNDLLLSKDGKKVFMSFNNSTNITFSNGIEEILNYGGIGFKHIENVKLPDTLKYLGGTWSSVKQITLPKGLEKIGGYAFKKAKLTNIVIPDSVKEIGFKAFAGSNLKSVEFGKNLTTIGQRAFINCKKLKSITIPKSVKKIDERAFSDCKILKKVKINSNNVNIVFDAFSNCKKLRSVTINGVKKISLSTFENCKKLSKVTIKNKKKAPKIAKNSFKNTKKGIKFVVKNKKVAKSLKRKLKGSGVRNAKILVGKKIVYQNING